MKFAATHHQHTRKRIHQDKQKYPHPNKKIRTLDKLVLVVSFLYPLTTLPQILKIWMEKNVAGVSLITWILYLALAIPMLFYGIAHKDKPITIMYVLWIVVHILVILGVLLFR